jgi:hypothetical protein
MKHYVVALDDTGSPIHNVDIATTDGEPKESTEDHREALSFCGMLNHYYNRGDELAGKKVGGYEVVSE